MNRKEYAKLINCKSIANREIQIDYIPHYEIGEVINPGLCWTCGGEFKVENERKYSIIFRVNEEIECHKVDYNNKKECEDLGCEGCENEEEILVDRKFEVVDFWEYDKETKCAEVYLRVMGNNN